MKKVLALLLMAALMLNVFGCAPKSKYDKLLSEKTGLERKCEQISQDRDTLRGEVDTKKTEIRNLSGQLKAARGQIRNLSSELAKVKSSLENVLPKN